MADVGMLAHSPLCVCGGGGDGGACISASATPSMTAASGKTGVKVRSSGESVRHLVGRSPTAPRSALLTHLPPPHQVNDWMLRRGLPRKEKQQILVGERWVRWNEKQEGEAAGPGERVRRGLGVGEVEYGPDVSFSV